MKERKIIEIVDLLCHCFSAAAQVIRDSIRQAAFYRSRFEIAFLSFSLLHHSLIFDIVKSC